jgi:tRNA-2-methylthio-N6-dimethylallyladenosine synthase
LLSELRFDTVHVAAYSPRLGTTASREFEDNIPPAEKKERLNTIESLQERIATEINAQLLGKTLEILVEGMVNGKWQGRTRTGKLAFFNDDNNCLGQLINIRINQTSKLAFFNDDNNCLGQLINIRINQTSPWSLQGKLIRTN